MSHWKPIETAPHGEDILVWFDHEADPYQDPSDQKKITDYAAWAEGGEFLDGNGWAIAKWFPQHFESEDEYGNGYWMPAAWFAREGNDYERVCNPLFWQPLTTPLPVRDPEDDCLCDNGKCWNNADPTGGMWVPCPIHGEGL